MKPRRTIIQRKLRKYKNYFQVTLSSFKASFNKKTKSTTPQRTLTNMTYIWFWVHCSAEYIPKSVKYRFTKCGRLIVNDPKEWAKVILKWLFLTWRPVFRKNQRWLSCIEKLREIFSSHIYTLILYHESITNCVSWCSYSEGLHWKNEKIMTDSRRKSTKINYFPLLFFYPT